MPAAEVLWSEEGTTPDAIEAALRRLLSEKHAQNGGYVPARVLNMLVFVEDRYSTEVAERLGGVGRYHASRTVVLSYAPDRESLNARVSVASEGEPGPETLALVRETAVVEIGERHLDDLPTIADPLVVSDLPTLLWSPYDHPEAADALLGLAQATLIDSIEAPTWSEAIARACALSEQAYVVDLAWLRSTPWRERTAAVFDPADMREALRELRTLEIRHHPDSTVAAMLLVGWLASRLGWELDRSQIAKRPGRDGLLIGRARAAGGADIDLRLRAAPELQVPGLAGISLSSSGGLELSLDRGPGGLHAHRRDGDHGPERAWTLLGASRGERGILGEGIRQALLRDPTYAPALHAAEAMLPEVATA
jgi:Glucose-6-phosphate dehydrogenase subunit C-terminal domain/Glucose-6-phosphate dehydrogenase subunit N-terminal domain